MKQFLLLVLFLSLLSCKSDLALLENPIWLKGAWSVKGTDQIETWHKINDFSYQGMGLKNSDKDPVISEYLRFYKLDDIWHYSATVPNQNRGKEIVFDEIHSSPQSFTVENAQHDFPKSIKYTLLNDSTISVILNETLENEMSMELLKIN